MLKLVRFRNLVRLACFHRAPTVHLDPRYKLWRCKSNSELNAETFRAPRVPPRRLLPVFALHPDLSPSIADDRWQSSGYEPAGDAFAMSKAKFDLPRTIRRHELKQIVPLADSTIYEMEQRGEFPNRYALSPRCVVWNLAEVEAWLAERRARPIERARAPDVRLRRTRPVRGPDPTARPEQRAEG